MKIRHKSHLKWAALLLSILALTMFLVACGANGTPAEAPPTPTPTPTPTPAVKNYPGDGYTLSYPTGWASSTQGTATTFTSNTDPTITFTIDVRPASAGADPTAYVAALATQFQNLKQDTTVPPTATVGGDTWKQAGATGDKSGVHLKGVLLVDQHPANTGKIYIITLTAQAASYEQSYTTYLKPILDSYKFTA